MRPGNTGGINFAVDEDGTSVNSMGLPNGGIEYMREVLPKMAKLVHGAGKLFVVNIAGFTPKEYAQLAVVAKECGADIIEINAGCPNAWDGGKQHEIIAYDFFLLDAVLKAVAEAVPGMILWVKLSPYANPSDRQKVAAIIRKYPIAVVVTSNTFPNVRLTDATGKSLLEVTGGRGGMAGTALRPIALANAEHFVELLNGYCDVYGAGGIQGWTTGQKFLDVGCKGLVVGTAFFHGEDISVFDNINQGYWQSVQAA